MAWIEIDGKDIPLLEPPVIKRKHRGAFFRVFFKYQRIIRITFLSIFLPAFAIVLLAPQKYTGVVKVFIKPSRAFLNMSPGSGDNCIKRYPSPDVLNSEIQIIKGRELSPATFERIAVPG